MSETETKDTEFFNPFDGTKGRATSQYLDIEERRQAERLRAVQEEREPQLDDDGALPASTGTPLVVDALRVDNSHYSNPTAVLNPRDVDPVATLPVGQNDNDEVDTDTNYRDMISGENNQKTSASTQEPTGTPTSYNDQNPNSEDYPTGPSGETLSKDDDEYLNSGTA